MTILWEFYENDGATLHQVSALRFGEPGHRPVSNGFCSETGSSRLCSHPAVYRPSTSSFIGLAVALTSGS